MLFLSPFESEDFEGKKGEKTEIDQSAKRKIFSTKRYLIFFPKEKKFFHKNQSFRFFISFFFKRKNQR
jgi:hypothetical protein